MKTARKQSLLIKGQDFSFFTTGSIKANIRLGDCLQGILETLSPL